MQDVILEKDVCVCPPPLVIYKYNSNARYPSMMPGVFYYTVFDRV